MLVRLFGNNFGVFRDDFELSLEAMDLGGERDRDRGYFEVQVEGEDRPLRLLRMAAIYGPNASGKSTLIRAAGVLRDLVAYSAPRSQEGSAVTGYEPFRLDEESRNRPTTLGCEIVVDNVIIEYQVSFTAKNIQSERIVAHRGQNKSVWLDRTGPKEIRVLQKNMPTRSTINLADVTRPNAAAISTAAQLSQVAFLPLFRELRRSLSTLDAGRSEFFAHQSINLLTEDHRFSRWALSRMLVPADIGVTDIGTQERREVVLASEDPAENIVMIRLDAVLSHRGLDRDYALDFEFESSGTQKMLALAGPWYEAIRERQTLFVDELSASLHPTLLVALLDAFNAPSNAPPSQIVFTVHDPSPLREVLRRDQVFFTEKDDLGVAKLYPLSDFNPRQVGNLQKQYLEGRFGAIPRQPHFDFFDEHQH